MKDDAPRLAVLIDADNVKISTITPLLSEIAQYGRITTRRIYGDFTSNNLAGWRAVIAEHAIQPIQQYRNTIGKNASDSALIIDAMDMLHSRRFDGFCIVSSDSDNSTSSNASPCDNPRSPQPRITPSMKYSRMNMVIHL